MGLPQDILLKYWGHSQFRPMQENIVLGALEGKDVMALLPTGGGKSICFQVPALCMEGICVVVSPLVALMQDQVMNLNARGISAFAVHSGISKRELDAILDRCVYEDVKFLYVSPERLKTELFIERFKRMKVCLLAVDEAHCISQWGYDFRPSYLQIAEIRAVHPKVPVMALTASATPQVVVDIKAKLLFRNDLTMAGSFARPNVTYSVLKANDKEGALLSMLGRLKGTGIVYCGTRARTLEMANLLTHHGHSAAAYHAGFSFTDKERLASDWAKNKLQIICATNAFGMGIDKPDVRFVLHADVPAQPEAYFQEAGRAGRDGKRSHSVMVFNEYDLVKLKEGVEKKFPPLDFVRRIYSTVMTHLQLAFGAGEMVEYEFGLAAFCKKFQLPPLETFHALHILELAGYLGFNEAMFTPSKAMFAVNKHGLYSYQVGHATLDPLIKTLLRMYGGLFEQFVRIKEEDIAKNMHSSLGVVKSQLELLQQHDIVYYHPQAERPTITILTPRQDESKLVFAPMVYEERKKSEQARAMAVQKYLTSHQCRSMQLLNYFGEGDALPCGGCDVCRDQKKHGLDEQSSIRISHEITNLLVVGPMPLETILMKLKEYDRDEVLHFIQWKMDINEWVYNDRLELTLPNFDDTPSV
jgi:ATP-dependent DNA helicase RecQ